MDKPFLKVNIVRIISRVDELYIRWGGLPRDYVATKR
jgi:hypothetical protein